MDGMTAKVSCFARAYHYKNNKVRVFGDEIAERLLGKDYEEIARSMTDGISFFLPDFKGTPEEGLRLIADRQLSPSVLGRSAFAESALENEKRLGCRQYVIVASGYDTYAVRNGDASVTVFELDRREMLEDKRMRLEKAGFKSNAVPVPCDLADPCWVKLLSGAGFRKDERAFASLLGISYYLNGEAFRALLAFFGGLMTEGSAICFDYPAADESIEAKTNRMLAEGAGERMKALYTYAQIEEWLSECGFLICEHLDAEGMTNRFFSAYNWENPEHPMEAPGGIAYVLAVRKGLFSC